MIRRFLPGASAAVPGGVTCGRALRGVCIGLLEHLGADRAALDCSVFPDSAAATPMSGLVRT